MITVKYNDVGSTQQQTIVSMKNLHRVLFDEQCIKQIARLMVADHLECFLDMVADMEDQPKTFKEATHYFDGAKQSLVDGLLPDLVSEFHDCLVRAIDQTVVNIKTVKMDASGLEDIEAEIV